MKLFLFFCSYLIFLACENKDELGLEKFPILDVMSFDPLSGEAKKESVSGKLKSLLSAELNGDQEISIIGKLNIESLDSSHYFFFEVIWLQCEREEDTIHLLFSINKRNHKILDYFIYYPDNLAMRNIYSTYAGPESDIILRMLLNKTSSADSIFDMLYIMELNKNGDFELRDTTSSKVELFNFLNPECPVCGTFSAHLDELNVDLEVRSSFTGDSNSFRLIIESQKGCITYITSPAINFSEVLMFDNSTISLSHSQDSTVIKFNNYKSRCEENFTTGFVLKKEK